MEQQLSHKSPRIEVVDALRGFAVMAIILIHNLEHFIFPVYPTHPPAWLKIIDKAVMSGVFSLFSGKAYAIFALLFGFTFYIQSSHQQLKGNDFGYRFLWRMLLLVGFSALNAAFFPAGDVLLLFVIVSLVLFLTRNWSDKAILLASALLLLQPVEWFHYFAREFYPAYQLPDLGVRALYNEVADNTKTAEVWDFVLCNITLGQKASLFWAISVGRFCQTAGLFLLGTYIGRRQLFVPTAANLRLWIKVLVVSAIAYAPLYGWKEVLMKNKAFIQHTSGTALDMWQKLAFTLVLVSSFVILYQSPKFQRLVSSLRSYGKMSLTNYISQSAIGSIIYFPCGMYLAPYCGYTLSLLIALCTFFLQLWFSKWWLSRHRQGPLEHIWHKWTWIGSGK